MPFLKTILNNCNGSFITQAQRVSPQILLQIIRWRKPRWIPRAKSKEFYVRKPTPIDSAEYEELKTRYNHYRTSVKSIRYYLTNATLAKAEKEDDHLQKEKEEEEDWERILQKNKEWNEAVAKTREARQAAEEEKRIETLEKQIALEMEQRLQMMQEAEALVMREKEQSKGFITVENLDTEIEKLLNTRKDYNFAIDKFGNIQKENPETTDTAKQKTETQHG